MVFSRSNSIGNVFENLFFRFGGLIMSSKTGKVYSDQRCINQKKTKKNFFHQKYWEWPPKSEKLYKKFWNCTVTMLCRNLYQYSGQKWKKSIKKFLTENFLTYKFLKSSLRAFYWCKNTPNISMGSVFSIFTTIKKRKNKKNIFLFF